MISLMATTESDPIVDVTEDLITDKIKNETTDRTVDIDLPNPTDLLGSTYFRNYLNNTSRHNSDDDEAENPFDQIDQIDQTEQTDQIDQTEQTNQIDRIDRINLTTHWFKTLREKIVSSDMDKINEDETTSPKKHYASLPVRCSSEDPGKLSQQMDALLKNNRLTAKQFNRKLQYMNRSFRSLQYKTVQLQVTNQIVVTRTEKLECCLNIFFILFVMYLLILPMMITGMMNYNQTIATDL